VGKVKEAFSEFSKPSIAIDAVIFRAKSKSDSTDEHPKDYGLQVLLVREIGHEQWQLPGTILRLGETPKDAMNRISDKKVDINKVRLNQLYTLADNVERDPRGHIISIVYYGVLKMSESEIQRELENKQEYGSARYEWQWFWVDKNNVPQGSPYGTVTNLMYDHESIIRDSVERLSRIVDSSDIAYEFIGKEFTISQLKSIYEMLVGRNIPSFRRNIKEKIEKVDKKLEGSNFRPAELYVKKTIQ
jgi:8-oxo-dGTP diphosphatase